MHQAGHQLARELLIHIESHVRELEADVGIELVRGHLVEKLVIKLRTGVRLLDVRDIFPEIVDADADAPAVEFRCDADRILYLVPGHEPAGETLPDDGTFGDTAQRPAFRKGNEEGSQHG